jgi:hypothetical protein
MFRLRSLRRPPLKMMMVLLLQGSERIFGRYEFSGLIRCGG